MNSALCYTNTNDMVIPEHAQRIANIIASLHDVGARVDVCAMALQRNARALTRAGYTHVQVLYMVNLLLQARARRL